MSGEFGGWFMSLISSPVCAAATTKCSSSTGTWILALSYYIHIVMFLFCLGHFATIEGNHLEIK
jgi:hypothetical protein